VLLLEYIYLYMCYFWNTFICTCVTSGIHLFVHVLLLVYIYLYMCYFWNTTHIYVLKILKFESHIFFIIIKYFRK